MSDFQAETGSRSVDEILSQLNARYIVVDIGGKLYFSKIVIIQPSRHTETLRGYIYLPLTGSENKDNLINCQCRL